MTDELKAYVPRRIERCPVALPAARFEGNVCRCVRDDEHAGECRLIDGLPLTSQAYAPHVRYELMKLDVPERLRPKASPARSWFARFFRIVR